MAWSSGARPWTLTQESVYNLPKRAPGAETQMSTIWWIEEAFASAGTHSRNTHRHYLGLLEPDKGPHSARAALFELLWGFLPHKPVYQ